jgi:acyl-coenzyme A synthetase/AMP-(fatty) acid ligase
MLISNLLGNRATILRSRTAFRSGDILISHERLHRDVETVARRLAASGICAGQNVGVHIGQSATHWCVLLALLRLGAVSVSLTSRFQGEIETLPNLTTIVCLEGNSQAYPPTFKRIEIKPDWLQSTSDSHVPLPPPEEAEHHFGRICFTSGTSGKPKAIHLDADTLKRRLSGTAGRSRIDAHSILWCGLGPDSAYGFTATLATWLAGGSVCFVTRPDKAYEELTGSNVNAVIASPAALTTVLQSCPAGSPAWLKGPVIVAGGRLSVGLRDLLLAKLSSEVLIAYGSSETGGVTLADARVLDTHPGAVGSIFQDVQGQIVDADGRVMPAEVPGRVRIKTSSSVTSYLNDPIATALHFPDGWFYPGDTARLSEARNLTLLGREVETLNVGGVKLSATEIDEAARSQAGIEDACAIVLPEQGRGPRLAIAAAGPPEAIRNLPPLLRSLLPSLPSFSVVPVSTIPRNSRGKINREEFAQEILELLQNPRAAAAENRFSILQDR